jgi:hypothetical protein
MRGVLKKVNLDAIALSTFMVVAGGKDPEMLSILVFEVTAHCHGACYLLLGTLFQASTLSNIKDAVPCHEYSRALSSATGNRRPFQVSKKEIATLNKDGLVVITDLFSQDQLSDMRKVQLHIYCYLMRLLSANQQL